MSTPKRKPKPSSVKGKAKSKPKYIEYHYRSRHHTFRVVVVIATEIIVGGAFREYRGQPLQSLIRFLSETDGPCRRIWTSKPFHELDKDFP